MCKCAVTTCIITEQAYEILAMVAAFINHYVYVPLGSEVVVQDCIWCA